MYEITTTAYVAVRRCVGAEEGQQMHVNCVQHLPLEAYTTRYTHIELQPKFLSCHKAIVGPAHLKVKEVKAKYTFCA